MYKKDLIALGVDPKYLTDAYLNRFHTPTRRMKLLYFLVGFISAWAIWALASAI